MKTYSLTDKSIELLSKILDLHAEKEKVIASNIANVETPGYAPAEFEFEKQLKQALDVKGFKMSTTNAGHISLTPASIGQVSGKISYKPDTTGIGDLNGVSLEEEMLALSENQLRYETAAQLLKKKLTIQKYVISGGQ